CSLLFPVCSHSFAALERARGGWPGSSDGRWRKRTEAARPSASPTWRVTVSACSAGATAAATTRRWRPSACSPSLGPPFQFPSWARGCAARAAAQRTWRPGRPGGRPDPSRTTAAPASDPRGPLYRVAAGIGSLTEVGLLSAGRGFTLSQATSEHHPTRRRPSMPIELYSWATPNGHKVHILLEELGLAYNVHPIDIGNGDQFDPDFLRISHNNSITAIEDPDGPVGTPPILKDPGSNLIQHDETHVHLLQVTGHLC